MFGVYDIPTNTINIFRRVHSDADNSVERVAQFPCGGRMSERYSKVFVRGQVPMRFRIGRQSHVLPVVVG
jgi:hypothetical protein